MSHTAPVIGQVGHGKTLDRRTALQLLDGEDTKQPPLPATLPIRVIIDEVEMLGDVIDGLDDAIENTHGDPIRYLQARERLVQLQDRAIHHESDLEVRYAELLEAARAEIAQTGNVTDDGPLVHLRHALASHGQLPPTGATPTQLLAQAR